MGPSVKSRKYGILKRLNCSVTIHIAFIQLLQVFALQQKPLARGLIVQYLSVLLLTVERFTTNAHQLHDNDNNGFGLSTQAIAYLLILYAEYRFLCRSHAVKFTRVPCVQTAFLFVELFQKCLDLYFIGQIFRSFGYLYCLPYKIPACLN